MDHMFNQIGLSGPKKSESNDGEGRAPIELLSKFLIAVQDREMKEALNMARELLDYEPDNKMIKEYHKYIMEYIAQGLDEEDDDVIEEESSSEEEEDDEENDSSDDESDAKVTQSESQPVPKGSVNAEAKGTSSRSNARENVLVSGPRSSTNMSSVRTGTSSTVSRSSSGPTVSKTSGISKAR